MATDFWTAEEVQRVPWWLVLLEGIASIILALLLFAAPSATLVVVIAFLGFFWLIKGFLEIVNIFEDRTAWGWKLFAGALGIIAGIVVLRHPLWSAVIVPAVMAWILGILGIVMGGIDLFVAFTGGGWGKAVLGVLSIFLGIVLIINPLVGGLVLVFILGGLALVGGIVAIVASLEMRQAQKSAT